MAMNYTDAKLLVAKTATTESDLRHLAYACMERLRELRVEKGHAPFACNRAKNAVDAAWTSDNGK